MLQVDSPFAEIVNLSFCLGEIKLIIRIEDSQN